MAEYKELLDASEGIAIIPCEDEMCDSDMVVINNWSLPDVGDRVRDVPTEQYKKISLAPPKIERFKNKSVKPYRNAVDPVSKCACETNVYRLPTEFIKATIDTTSYNKYVASKLVEYMDSVGALKLGNCYIGTVFRVGSVYVMTAAHVVEQLNDVSRNKIGAFVIFDEKACERSEGESGWSVKDIVFEDKQLDVCVLELLVPNNSKLQDPLKLSIDKVHETKASQLTFLGYGNPHSGEKVMEHCRIVGNKDKLKGKFSLVKYVLEKDDKLDSCGFCEFEKPDKIIINSKMTEGGSGSPGFVTVGNPTGNLKVVAMLQKSIPRYYYELSETEQAYAKDVIGLFSVCYRMSSLYESMTESDPELARELFYISSDKFEQKQNQECTFFIVNEC